MLSLIGLIALIYVTIKFFPDILLFAVKTIIVLVGLWLLAVFLITLFGTPILIINA